MVDATSLPPTTSIEQRQNSPCHCLLNTLETLEELDEVLAERCRILADDPDQIKAHTLFEWWPHHN